MNKLLFSSSVLHLASPVCLDSFIDLCFDDRNCQKKKTVNDENPVECVQQSAFDNNMKSKCLITQNNL